MEWFAAIFGQRARSAGSIPTQQPEPIPVILLARLAVDRSWRKRGVGRALFRDAALRILSAADLIGVRGVLTHAVSSEAREFYLALGFDPSQIEEMTLMMKLDDIRAAL